MFLKRKIQAAQARSQARSAVPPGKRPLVSKRPGERLPIGVTPGKRPTPIPPSRKGMTGVNITTDADMRGTGKLVRQPVPARIRNLLSKASKTASGLKNPISFRQVQTSEMPEEMRNRGARPAPKIAGALGSGVAKTMKGLPTKAISNALKTFAASKARTFKKGGMAATSTVGKAVKRKTADVRGRAMKGK